MNIFKKSSDPPAPKPSAFTAEQIIQDITSVMKQDLQNITEDTNNPFFTNHTESWYADLKECTKVTNELCDAIEIGQTEKDDLERLKKNLQENVKEIRQKATEVLQNNS